MKKIMWGKSGRTLMGDVIEETERLYIVIVTSFESKRDHNLLGQKMAVSKLVVKES